MRRVQAELKRRGYNAGTVDGVYGRNTRRALQAFQRDNGLSPSGRIDARTLAALAAPPATTGAAATAVATSATAGSPSLRNRCAELQRITRERWFHVQTRDGKSGWIRDGEHLDWDETC